MKSGNLHIIISPLHAYKRYRNKKIGTLLKEYQSFDGLNKIIKCLSTTLQIKESYIKPENCKKQRVKSSHKSLNHDQIIQNLSENDNKDSSFWILMRLGVELMRLSKNDNKDSSM